MGQEKIVKKRKLNRRDFLRIISGDVLKGVMGTGEFSTVKLMRNFDVIVDEGLCTLCGACVHECKKGALIMEEDGSMLLLKFDQSLCDGCPICEEKCPEGAIKVVEVEAKEYRIVQKASSKIAFCKSCGAPIGSSKAIEKVAAAFMREGLNAQLQTLYLCRTCRTSRLIRDGMVTS